MTPFDRAGSATTWFSVLAALAIALTTFAVSTPDETSRLARATSDPEATATTGVHRSADAREVRLPDTPGPEEAASERAAGAGSGATAGADPEQADVLASYDFDDGMQGWTVEDVDAQDCDSDDDTLGARDWAPSSWEHRPDTDGYDRGLNRRGHERGDHHVAVVEYRNCSDTRLISPRLSGDGTPVTLDFSQRHFTERDWETGEPYDFLDVEWRSAPDGAWQRLDRCHGRGRYPLWDPVVNTFTPDGAFQVSFHFTADSRVDGRSRWSRTIRTVTSGARQGLGVWVDDVSLFRREQPQLACVAGSLATDDPDGEEGGSAGESGKQSTSPTASESAANESASLPSASSASVGDTSPAVVSGSDPVGLQGHELLVDRATHLGYQRELDRDLIEIDRWLSDPYRWDWDGTRGRIRDVWLLNRYDAPLAGTMYAPLEDGRYPTVIFVGGGGFSDFPGWGSLLQRLAEEGYVVLSVSPQGYLGLGDRQSAIKPSREFCGDPEATADAWWRQPQEAGLVETDFCAGEISRFPDYSCAGGVDYPVCAWIDERTGHEDDLAEYQERNNQEIFGPSWTFAVTDALQWLLGPDNPWRHLVDRDRIGTAGQSVGGFAARVAANVHPQISAAVAIESGGGWPDGLEQLDTPMLMITAESANGITGGTFGMRDPANTSVKQHQRDIVHAVRDSGVDTGWVVLADATHNNFPYVPYPSQYAAVQASRWAQPVAYHYLLAWFDHHLKGLPDARERLLGDTFDGTADRTAIGVGRWDPIEGNVPYRIEGRTTAQHLSERFPNWIYLDGETTDLR